MSEHTVENGEGREAVLGEVMHDRGSEPESGWFILGVDGYFDVDNACWCKFQAGDAPWTTDYFDLFGTVTEQFARRVGAAERYRDIQAKTSVIPPGDADTKEARHG